MKLDQYLTPAWAAELLVRRHFTALSASDTVVEMTCGDGRFLMAIPPDVDAYGIEIDPAMAAEAVANSGRQVLVGDFRHVTLPRRPTVVLGNPPFQSALIDDLLDRCYQEMEYGGRVGLLLPVYIFQTAGTVMRYARRWSLGQELIPRNLFDGLTKPLMFATFEKERQTFMSGLFLYSELHALESLRREFRQRFVGNGARANVWRETVAAALTICGGRATLQQLYRCIENNRPTENPWWREKVRQIAGQHFERVAPGEFKMPEAA
jgi:adenine-specific DNA-methyltransferase